MPREIRSSLSLCLLATLALAVAAPAQEIRLGKELQVNTYTANYQRLPSVAADGDGDFVVVWYSHDQDGSSYGVFGRRFSSAGAPLATEFQVNTYTTYGQYLPAVEADADGDFVVAWSSNGQDGSAFGVFARRFSSAGAALATEFQVNTYVVLGQYDPSVAASAGGDFVVAWDSSGQDGSSRGIFARRFSSAGAALATELQVNTYTSSDQRHASVAADADGDFVVAWSSNGQDGSSYGIFARRFSSAGAALATEFQVNTHTTSNQLHPSVAADAGGDFVVAWQSSGQDGEYWGIFARRFSSTGAPLASEFQVNAYTPSDQRYGKVATDADGDFVVTWYSTGQDGSGYGVFARRFSSAGAALASEFQVNTYTLLGQSVPSVATDLDGGFVVAWQSAAQDGSADGVFAQLFAGLALLDIDGDGTVTPLTDGLLVLRYLFGFTGATLTTGAVNLNGCTRCSAATIEAYLQTLL